MGNLNEKSTTNLPNEISFKEILLGAKELGVVILSKKLFLTILVVLGITIGFLYAYFNKPKYVAELTFVIDENNKSGLSNYSAIASQFGFDLGGKSSGLFSGDNIIEFLKSRAMIQKTLLSTANIQGSETTLIDYYLQIVEGKATEMDTNKSQFQVGMNRDSLSFTQDSILSSAYYAFLNEHLSILKKDPKLGFFIVSTRSTVPEFSKLFTEKLVDEAITFYINTKTSRAQTVISKLQFKADSLELALNRTTYNVAQYQDMNQNPARNIVGVKHEVGQRDKMMLQTMYAEVIKNLEISKIALDQEMPIIQIVDKPYNPLPVEKTGYVKAILVSLIFFIAIGIIIIILKYYFQKILNS